MTIEIISATVLWMIVPIGLLGSLLHFAFDWSKHNRLVAIFAAVNESYWEHIKIAIWPVLLLQIALFGLGGFSHASFIPAATVSLYSIPVSMVGMVFLYKAVSKRNILWVDITSFFLTIFISQIVFVSLLNELSPSGVTIGIAGLFLLGLISAFLLFTIYPPKEPDVFVDPTNQRYGLKAHPDMDQEGKTNNS